MTSPGRTENHGAEAIDDAPEADVSSSADELDHAATHGLAMFRAFGKACYGMLLVRRADLAGGVSLLR